MTSSNIVGPIGDGLPALYPPRPPTPFERGILIFNEELTRDPQKRIGPARKSNAQHLPCTLDELLNDTVKIDQERKKQQSPGQTRIENLIATINKHATVIDVLIQQQPDITAVVWGGIRFLIGVAAKEISTSAKISESLIEILDTLGSWNKYIEIFDNSERVRLAASRLFSEVINFLVRSRLHFQRPRAVRYAKSGLTPFTQRMDSIMASIRGHGKAFEREVRLASEIRVVEDRKVQAEQIRRDQEEINQQERYRQKTSLQLEKGLILAQKTAAVSDDMNVQLQNDKEHREIEAFRRTSDDALGWLQQDQSSPKCVPEFENGTCRWIRETNEFKVWQEKSSGKILGVFGPPGCGKSSIADYLYTNSTAETKAIHFFQNVTNRDHANSTSFATAIITKLLENPKTESNIQYPLIINKIAVVSGQFKRMLSCIEYSTLWSILLMLINGLEEFELIVDGLDECDQGCWREISMDLTSLAKMPNIRVAVLSRHHPELESLLNEAVKIHITPEVVANDILLFVKCEIDRFPGELQRVQSELLDQVLYRSHGLFLWAKTMLKHLRYIDTRKEQLACLNEYPTELNSVYETLVTKRTPELSPERISRRRELFLALFAMFRSPTCEELSVLLALEPGICKLDTSGMLNVPETAILRLCWPLVKVSAGYVHLIHETVNEFLVQPVKDHMDPTIHITSDESETYLAQKCIAMLSQEIYRSSNNIALLLRRNVATTVKVDEDQYFYQYAATHWWLHLTALSEPDVSLIEQAARFLSGNEFVYWSEYIYQLDGTQGTVLEVQAKLRMWHQKLSRDLQDVISLDEYFTGPYRALSKSYEGEGGGGDKILPYLCLFQLGDFYNISARLSESFEVKKTVAEGLVNLLGEKSPLALKAQSSYAFELLGQARYREAEQIFDHLFQIQRDVIGRDRPDCYQSQQRQAMAQYYMTRNADAKINITESMSGFIQTVGPTDFLYLLSQIMLGLIQEENHELERATMNFEYVWRYRVSVLGPDNPMAVWARSAMVSTCRKLGRYEEAEKAIEESLESRRRTTGSKASITVDSCIQQIVLYREMGGRAKEAMELVDLLLDGALADPWFERYCQVEHLHALLETDNGKLESPRKILQALVDQVLEIGVQARVRSLLWVKLDLAVILRRLDRETEALMLFDDLVTSVDSDSTSSWEEAQAPSTLKIAEDALRLVRQGKRREADLLLHSKGLKWVRLEDFWILSGGPVTDNAWLKEPFSSELLSSRRNRDDINLYEGFGNLK